MSGVHGLASAPGARRAVLRAPVRRALLLAALVFGLLVTAWLADSGHVRAEERPATATSVDTVSVTGQTPRAVPDLSGEGRLETDQPDTAHGGTESTGTERADAASADTAAPVSAATGLDEPLTGAVTAVGENTRLVLNRSTGDLTSPAPRDTDAARRVGDVVHGVAAPVEEYLATVPAIARGAQEPTETAPEVDEDVPAADADTQARIAPVQDTVVTSALVFADTGSAEGHLADPADEPVPAHAAADAVAPHTGLNSVTNATAQGCPAGGTAVAAFLPTTGPLALPPGQIQAARHVLCSVPAESADEPIFSPD